MEQTCFLFYRKLLFPIEQKPSGGCALVQKENVANATALGARVPLAELFL